MTMTESLRDYVHAAFAGLWVHTQEPDEALRGRRARVGQMEGAQLGGGNAEVS